MGSLPQGSDDDACFGRACGKVLAEKYPVHTAKMISRELKITTKAAENLLTGHISKRSMTLLVGAYGVGFLLEAAGRMAGQTLNDTIDNFIIENAARAREEQAAAKERELGYRARLEILREGRANAASSLRAFS